MGSPAQAGIDRVNNLAYAVLVRFPRTGGDRPVYGSEVPAEALVPPHRRG